MQKWCARLLPVYRRWFFEPQVNARAWSVIDVDGGSRGMRLRRGRACLVDDALQASKSVPGNSPRLVPDPPKGRGEGEVASSRSRVKFLWSISQSAAMRAIGRRQTMAGFSGDSGWNGASPPGRKKPLDRRFAICLQGSAIVIILEVASTRTTDRFCVNCADSVVSWNIVDSFDVSASPDGWGDVTHQSLFDCWR